ncbi:MAG: formate dehydrogenase accessory sulfurtransferase FdhD [Acidobacteriota bacterium]
MSDLERGAASPPPGAAPGTSGLLPVAVERRGEATEDEVIVELPLEIRVDGESFAVTLRTPGADRELTAGYLLTEGVIEGAQDLRSLERLADPLAYDPDNVVDARLSAGAAERLLSRGLARRERLAVSACGLCGKAQLEEIYRRWPEIEPMEVDARLVQGLPKVMEDAQVLFPRTGGVHGAALFDRSGALLDVAEDVGRHNALDKLIGAALLNGEFPWRERIVVMSSRAGFEIVQKALMARAPVLVTVGAASSLAVDAARRGGLTLYSFVRRGRANRHL